MKLRDTSETVLRWISLVVMLVVAGLSRPAAADAVDAAFVRGNEAAARADWDAAVEAYEEAASLMPERSALVSYNLGTAYAELGRLGRATYHLRRALDYEARPTAEIAESARYNLDVVRRRIELRATSAGTLVDRPETWWDVVVDALRAQGVAWLSLASGVALLFVLLLRARRKRWGMSRTPILGSLAIVFGLCWALPGLLHALTLAGDRDAPPAIVLGDQVDAREGPGNHRAVVHTLQGGAKVRVVDRSPGWRRVRLPGGVEGWVPEDHVARLDAGSGRMVAPSSAG